MIGRLDALAEAYRRWSEGADFAALKHMLNPVGTFGKFVSLLVNYPRFVFPDGREESIEQKYLEPEENPLICQVRKKRSPMESVYTRYRLPAALADLDAFLQLCGTLSQEARRLAARAHVLIEAIGHKCSVATHPPRPLEFDDLRQLVDLCESMNVEVLVRESDPEMGTAEDDGLLRRVGSTLSHLSSAVESIERKASRTNRSVLRLGKETRQAHTRLLKNSKAIVVHLDAEEPLDIDDPKHYSPRAIGVELEMLEEAYQLYNTGKYNRSAAAERMYREATRKKRKHKFKNLASFKTQV